VNLALHMVRCCDGEVLWYVPVYENNLKMAFTCSYSASRDLKNAPVEVW
jgi:hypothetical protein